MSLFAEVEQIVLAEFAAANMKPTKYGINQAVLECAEMEQEFGQDPADQMHYIINQAIPDGLRAEWF